MSISAGAQLGHYQVLAPIGAGGMGKVYRACDTRLNRDVAIKVLPEAFAQDPDRMARFTREAQVLASLNQPNIAAIYGIEENAIVMELIEGELLRGPQPLETARIRREIRRHERGFMLRTNGLAAAANHFASLVTRVASLTKANIFGPIAELA
jgi:serine/threonine protein kinase